MNKLNRPFVWCVFYFILGILGASFNKACPYIFLLAIMSIFALVVKYKQKFYVVFVIFLVWGFLRTYMHPVIQESPNFKGNTIVRIEGYAKEIKETDFGKQILLKNVVIVNDHEIKPIKSKLILECKKNVDINIDHKVMAQGIVKESPIRMNPSDINYASYLRSKGIVATIKVKQQSSIENPMSFLNRIYLIITNRIYYIWENRDHGLIQGMLLGSTEDIPGEITALYQKTGIAHVLAVSGFNISLLVGMVLFLASQVGLGYKTKYVLCLILIWGYSILTGTGVAIVRAAVMASTAIVSKCIWEEDDPFINLALAAFIVLSVNPFELYQVGFLISFLAVASLFCGNIVMEKLKPFLLKKYKSMCSALIYWVCVMLGIYPILSYFFYEVPLLCSVLNLILIPLFSAIIVLAAICLGISLFSMPVAKLVGEVVVIVLDWIIWGCEKMAKIPYATLCTGKPSLMSLGLYYILLSLIVAFLLGYIKNKKVIVGQLIVLCLWMSLGFFTPKMLHICHLYIGQGDAAVLTMPNNKVILIDGGKYGKGKTIDRYIKYRGISEISAAIVSHADEDHIGGIIELIEMGAKIRRVFVSGLENTGLTEKLFEVCKEREVSISTMNNGDRMIAGKAELFCVAPDNKELYLQNSNEKSIVFLLSYKQFSALFTGDIDSTVENKINSKLRDVDYVKIAHHGSKTSTSEGFLKKVNPEYAVISCGINNIYSHPNREVVERLKDYEISVLRTDCKGAITVETDGNRVIMNYQVKGNELDDNQKMLSLNGK